MKENHYNDFITKEMADAYAKSEVSVKELIDAGWDSVSVWVPSNDVLDESYKGEFVYKDGKIISYDLSSDENSAESVFVRPVDVERYEIDEWHNSWKVCAELVMRQAKKVDIPPIFQRSFDIRARIYEYLTDGRDDRGFFEDNDLASTLNDILKWLSEDEVVKWFVEGFCGNDEEAVLDALGDEDGKAILEYHKAHCAK